MQKRERYNARARKSVAGSSHKREKGRSKQQQAAPDTNAEIVQLKTTEEKELDRKEILKQELLAQFQSKASSKKRKRLEKYIEKKLKKEERLELFEKISKTQAELPSTIKLHSSATLGSGKFSTAQERLDRLEDKEVRRAVDSRQRRGNHFANVAEDDSDEDGIMQPNDAREESEGVVGVSPRNPLVIVDSAPAMTTKQTEPSAVAVGVALQRNADGSVVKPTIMKRKEKGARTILRKWKRPQPAALPSIANDDSESSFDSSDSANDVSENEGDPSESDASDQSEDDGSDVQSSASEDESSDDADTTPPPPRRSGGFKQWAMSQLSAAKGYVAPVEEESTHIPIQEDSNEAEQPPPRKKRKVGASITGEMRGPLGEDIALPPTSLAQHLKSTVTSTEVKRKVVLVTRLPEVEDARLLLPIVTEEQPIMEAILLNPVVVVCGETGSGKTTQVPQFLYEAGFGSPDSDNPGMIGVTQPRRVAAMSMASRVAHELSLPSSRVSYQIRYDATVSSTTAVKFMTDGVLLRELASDFLLIKYSVIIIDEAHERSMNTDILIGVLSRVVRLREDMWKEGKDGIKPLRLIIMSATLRVSDFVENTTLFASPPPVISVPARQHPVTVHFNRRTASDYVNEAVRKASKIHARLPPGGILIFLTGQNEISGVRRRLEERYGERSIEERKKRRKNTQRRLDAQNFFRDKGDTASVKPSQFDVEAEEMDLGDSQPEDLALDVDGQPDGSDDVDMDALDTEDEDEALGIDAEESDVPMHIVPLYSLLPSDKQMKVFEPPPAGTRLVVVATNVAETSLTIPGIRYVIDCGRAKERRYDLANGIQSFQISWTSKASASQRAGRAGRTGPGHCYRLYSSAVFENYFDQFSQPEILRVPIEGVVLQMKCMHIDAVANFPFPTPPDRHSLRQAEKILTHLGALEATLGTALNGPTGGKITDLGRTMSLFPLSPRFSKMLVSSRRHGCLPYVIVIVSAMSVGDPFLREEALGVDDVSENEEELSHITSEKIRSKVASKLRRRAYFQSQQLHASLGKSSSDLFSILSVVGAYEYAGGGQTFCAEHFVRPKAMEEIRKLRSQISSIVQTNFPDIDAGFTPKLAPPTDLQLKILRQLITSCFIDQVAVRKELVEKDSATGVQYTTANGVPYRALGIAEDVYIHPSSAFAMQSPPDYIVYHEVVRTSQVWLKGLTVINPAWLSSLGKASLCTFSKPFKNKAGELMVTPRFGPDGWELPPVKADTQQ
ncbi:P-loop containing nucleoside triphosphate hydrolase protein [Gloeopeniophorella convolvens]|nr:P-loop containing nucleoside triphosphate hydrolase protein [Gloeopeniophorella convolvens]